MDILKDLQNMIDRSFAFAKRNEIELRGNGRESDNVYIIPEMELLAFRDKLGEYVESHKVIAQEVIIQDIQEPKKLKKEMKRERGQRATAAIYDDAIGESFYFPLGRS